MHPEPGRYLPPSGPPLLPPPAAPPPSTAAEKLTEQILTAVTGELEAELEKQRDIAADRGRRLRDRGQQMRAYRWRLADTLGWPRSTSWQSLVTEIEARMKEKTDG